MANYWTKTAKPTNPAWNAVRVKCPDGNTYIVSRVAVEDDYASMHIQLDGMSLGHATELARQADGLDVWFREQFRLEDVRLVGHRIARPTYEQLTAPSRIDCEDICDCQISFIRI